MLRSVLRLFKPRYALTALLIFGAWRGYSFVKSVSEKLPLLHSFRQTQQHGLTEEQVSVEIKRGQSQQEHLGPTIAAIRLIHPALRVMYWLVMYALLCFASVPLIKWVLVYESNLANAILVIVYSVLGLLLAFVFVAFTFTWATAIFMVAALVFSVVMIIWLAGELERLRVEDTWR